MATDTLTQAPLVVIVGPTASGKTALAIRLAKQFSGEIICADSRTVYKDLDIGTAKPTKKEQAEVPHWGIDIVEPNEPFSAADFKSYAVQRIDEIRARGNVPFLVGGTGLYVDGVLFDYQFGAKASSRERVQLEKMTVEELQEHCIKNNIQLPENRQNKRYLVRAIERSNSVLLRKNKPISTSIIVGIATDRDLLRTRIIERAEQLFDNGVVEEAIMLGRKYGWRSEAMTGNIYRLVHRYLEGELTLSEIKDKFTTSDWRLAKRQLTFLRRNSFITWLPLTEAQQYISEQLVNEQKS